MDIANIDTAKSFATEANLERALARLGLSANWHVVVRNRAGRWTAIFPVSQCNGYLGQFAQHGFKTIG